MVAGNHNTIIAPTPTCVLLAHPFDKVAVVVIALHVAEGDLPPLQTIVFSGTPAPKYGKDTELSGKGRGEDSGEADDAQGDYYYNSRAYYF